tara:strand:+ start:271 stop:639 length:369 start_codon:yes stop_codon:yes gene_type:complete
MYVIAKYNPDDVSTNTPVMELFRNHVCSIDVTPDGVVCHGQFSDEVFSDWYANNALDTFTWTPVELEMLCAATIVVKGATIGVENAQIYIAEDESVISTAQAKACGLWTQILDQLYEAEARR